MWFGDSDWEDDDDDAAACDHACPKCVPGHALDFAHPGPGVGVLAGMFAVRRGTKVPGPVQAVFGPVVVMPVQVIVAADKFGSEVSSVQFEPEVAEEDARVNADSRVKLVLDDMLAACPSFFGVHDLLLPLTMRLQLDLHLSAAAAAALVHTTSLKDVDPRVLERGDPLRVR